MSQGAERAGAMGEEAPRGVARQADSMQSAFVQCGFRDVPAGTRPSLKGIMNTLVRACAGCARIVERVRIVIVREWASPAV